MESHIVSSSATVILCRASRIYFKIVSKRYSDLEVVLTGPTMGTFKSFLNCPLPCRKPRLLSSSRLALAGPELLLPESSLRPGVT
jgi:hypothetical protein